MTLAMTMSEITLRIGDTNDQKSGTSETEIEQVGNCMGCRAPEV